MRPGKVIYFFSEELTGFRSSCRFGDFCCILEIRMQWKGHSPSLLGPIACVAGPGNRDPETLA